MQKLLLFFKNLYGNRRFRTKIIINFIIINLIITISIGLIYYFKSSSIIEEELTRSVDYSISRLKLDIYAYADRIMEVSDSISTNSSIRNVLLHSENDANFETQLKNYVQISDIYNSMPYNSNIYKVSLFLENTFNNTIQTMSFRNIREAESMSWYSRVNQLNGKILWTDTYNYPVKNNWQENLISCTRVLKDFNLTDRTIAYVCIDVRERDLFDILQEAEKATNGKIYLIGSAGNIISCNDKNLIGTRLSAVDGLGAVDLSAITRTTLTVGQNESLFISDNLPEFNWSIVTIISMQNFVDKSRVIIISLFQVSLLAFILSLILAALLSLNITGRIKKLIRHIHSVDMAKYATPLAVTNKDEISELIEAFNKMIYENHVLVNEVYLKNIETKNTELKLLQAQINPHFLYNALDTANWMAQKYKANDIMKFLKLLSNFYRLSLSVGKSVVSIETEIEHVKSYINIQKIKTSDEIEAIYKIAPDILEYSIPKLVLQPIVENAIIHGIQESDDQRGIIEIEGSMAQSVIRLLVKDNGIGLDPGQLLEIRRRIQAGSDNGRSYGLRNVNQRIRHYFGENSGISITSEPGRGTQVEIYFPAIRLDETK